MKFVHRIGKLVYTFNSFILSGFLDQDPNLNDTYNGRPHVILNIIWLLLSLLIICFVLSKLF